MKDFQILISNHIPTLLICRYCLTLLVIFYLYLNCPDTCVVHRTTSIVRTASRTGTGTRHSSAQQRAIKAKAQTHAQSIATL